MWSRRATDAIDPQRHGGREPLVVIESSSRRLWLTAAGAATLVYLAMGMGRCAPPAHGAQGPMRHAGFRASAVKVDITPQTPQWLMGYQARQSDGVLDNIYHRVVAFDTGEAQFYLISSDLCLFSPTFYDSVTRDLQKETGIDPKHVLWSVTHSHAAPEVGPPDMYKVLLGRSDHEYDRGYTALATRTLIDAVRAAREKLEPARVAFGSGVAMANINRRAMDVDGRVSIGLNPDGPVDRQFNLIRLNRPDGSLIALIANYAMHGTVMNGQNLKVSGDGPGVVTAYLEQKLGGTVLYVNGAAGNIAPIYSVYPNPSAGHLSQFRVLLGDRILAAVASLGPGTADVTHAARGEDRRDAAQRGLGVAGGARRLRRDRRPPAGAAADPVRPDQRHRDLVGAGRDVLRNRDGCAGTFPLLAYLLLRLHQRMVRIPADREGLRRRRLRAAHVPVLPAGRGGRDAGRDWLHPGVPALAVKTQLAEIRRSGGPEKIESRSAGRRRSETSSRLLTHRRCTRSQRRTGGHRA